MVLSATSEQQKLSALISIKNQFSQSSPCTVPIKEEPRLFKVNNENNAPSQISESTIENKGTSLKDDNLLSLIMAY